MQTTKPHLPPLAEYADLQDVRKSIGRFPTDDSFRWFLRINRQRLVDSGAMILVAGRQMFHPELVKQIIVEAGSAAAQRRTAA